MLMVQSNPQVPMKSNKLKGPPPVPPRPNQSVVAEALAKTRRAVAESRAGFKARVTTKQDQQKNASKAKTIERTDAAAQPSNTSPKQNGLARVKSFIRDVISDRGSSSDERKSSGHNSRRSSSDSSSPPARPTVRKSTESVNSKAVKTCKQILVRSLSTSNKLDQDSKSRVPKSCSFAEKALPSRKAPPPPLSPKPKIKPIKLLPTSAGSLEQLHDRRLNNSPDVGPYSTPIDAKNCPLSPSSDAPYATVEEMQEFDSRLRNSPSKQSVKDVCCDAGRDAEAAPAAPEGTPPRTESTLERKTSRVTERLISEILAGRNKNDANAVIDKGKARDGEKLPDMNNHEMLIYELQTMRSQSDVPGTVAGPSPESPGRADSCSSVRSEERASDAPSSSVHSEGGDSANPYACVIDDGLKSRLRKQFRAISNMSLQGLPPLPKSLSGFADAPEPESPTLSEGAPTGTAKPPTDFESQLVYLKKEMGDLCFKTYVPLICYYITYADRIDGILKKSQILRNRNQRARTKRIMNVNEATHEYTIRASRVPHEVTDVVFGLRRFIPISRRRVFVLARARPAPAPPQWPTAATTFRVFGIRDLKRPGSACSIRVGSRRAAGQSSGAITRVCQRRRGRCARAAVLYLATTTPGGGALRHLRWPVTVERTSFR
ncbi:hypothetical protein EVAR_167_1 [Eumeta japonica]|uniref:Uncharacterized protein n=1 Tax=Eumeta variegata TaxID=151549 RepID=A0A4C1S8V0_EUMVA|nr:hypothetical protein EVAR_167_1 [Eumeta japonica]